MRTAAAKAKEAVQVAATAKATVKVLKAQRAALKLASTLPALQHAQFKAAHAVEIAKQALEATDDDTAESTRAEKALAQAKAAEKLATERVRAARAAVKKSHGSVAQAIKKAGAAAVVAAVRKGVAATHSAMYHAKKAGAAAKAVAKQAILVSKRAAIVAALVAAAEGKPVAKAPQTVDSLLSAMQVPAKKPHAAKQAAQPIQARATPSDAVSKKTATATKSKTPRAKEVKEVKEVRVAPLPKATPAPRLQKAAQAAKAHLANMKKVAQLMPNNPVAQAALVKAGHKLCLGFCPQPSKTFWLSVPSALFIAGGHDDRARQIIGRAGPGESVPGRCCAVDQAVDQRHWQGQVGPHPGVRGQEGCRPVRRSRRASQGEWPSH